MEAQYVDAVVSRTKFDREVDEYRTLEVEYRRRGWFLVEASFPRALILMAAPQLKPPALVVGVAFDYTNYDVEPPSVQLVDPFTGEPYLAKDLPTRLFYTTQSVSEIALPGAPGAIRVNQMQSYMQFHALDEMPFLCIAGVREYHRHPGHTGDPWELHRVVGAGKMVRLLDIIYRFGVAPIMKYAVQMTPEVSGFEQAPPL